MGRFSYNRCWNRKHLGSLKPAIPDVDRIQAALSYDFYKLIAFPEGEGRDYFIIQICFTHESQSQNMQPAELQNKP